MTADARPAAPESRVGGRPDGDAWSFLTDNIGFVSRTLRWLGIPDTDLEDVSQEVFLIAHQRHRSFEGRASPTTWLYRICWNTAANHRRRLTRIKQRSEPLCADTEPVVSPPQEVQLGRQRAREQLSRLLDGLDDDKRAVFVLYEIEQLSMREVIEIVGCPLQTGYSRLKAAHRLVREAASRLEVDREEPT